MRPFSDLTHKLGRYRWTICALLFFATTVNYLDRQVLSLLKSDLEVEFNWSDTDYANIVMAFQLVYAVSMLFAGRIVDWLGTKAGYAWSLVVWSLGAASHALARGTGGFIVARAVLGFGESGNFPAAIKTTAEWFPRRERALATGIFNSGANVGAILAPLTVPWIAMHMGWQGAFVIVGGIGFLWLAFWLWLYRPPATHPRLGPAERAYIESDRPRAEATPAGLPWYARWGRLLAYRQTWAFAFGKLMTDGVWWFFLFWLPAYLKAEYAMTGTQIAVPVAVLYTMTCAGSIGGGWLPMVYIRRGHEPYAARMRAMLWIALCPLVVLLAQPLGRFGYWLPVLLIGVGASAHQAWSANLFTTVSDMFPGRTVASVTGIGGMAGGLGGILMTKVGGWLFDAYRHAGIAKTWAAARAAGLGNYVDRVRALTLVNQHGSLVDLDHVELGSLPSQVMAPLRAIDGHALAALQALEARVVTAEMSTAYAIMFGICALAYIVAWVVMKILVPHFRPIEDL